MAVSPQADTATGCSIGLRLFLTLFFGAFAAFGTYMVIEVYRDAASKARTSGWVATPCFILDSKAEINEQADLDNADEAYSYHVSYEYGFGNTKNHRGSIYKVGFGGADSYEDVAALADRYPPESDASCYVNPSRPTEAVLARHSILVYALVLFPILFAVIGFGGLIGAWSFGWSTPAPSTAAGSAADDEDGSITQKAKGGGWGALGIAAFFSIFFFIGAAFLYSMVGSWPKMIASSSWPSVQCTILNSRIFTHEGDDSDTYSIDVFYEYEVNGIPYRASRYSWVGGSSSSHKHYRDLKKKFSKGSKHPCYVNPDDPREACLSPGWSNMAWIALVPLIFMLVGGGGMFFAVTHWARARHGTITPIGRPKSRATRAADLSWLPDLADRAGPCELKPQKSPLAKFIGAAFVAILWNGIAGAIWWFTGHWFLLLFLAFGLIIVAVAVHAGLAMFNAQPHLVIADPSIPLGGRLELDWQLIGNVNAIRNWRIWIEAVEEASYTRGTDTITDNHTIHEVTLLETEDTREMTGGHLETSIPEHLMHSFEATHNKVVWTLKVHGDIRFWPDIQESFPITIVPASFDETN